MELTRFKECCAAFGAERRRWPEREHALYNHLADTPEGMALLAEARRVDGFLDIFEPAPPDMRRVYLIAARTRPTWRRFGSPAAALAACATLGIILGCLQSRDAADVGSVADMILGPQSLQEFGL